MVCNKIIVLLLFLAFVSYAGCNKNSSQVTKTNSSDENETIGKDTSIRSEATANGTTSETAHVHVGWKINLIVVALLFILAGIALAVTWRLRDSIKIHNRLPKKLLHFKMTEQRFSFNQIRKRFSLAITPKIDLARSRMSMATNSPAPAREPRNMGFMKQYTNGMKRDSWDTSRDSITGGPRCSWQQDTMTNNPTLQKLYTSQEPRLSTIEGSKQNLQEEDEHWELLSDESDHSEKEMNIFDV